MPRPYGMPRPYEEEDSVDVVRHEDECIQLDVKVSGNLKPASTDCESCGRQADVVLQPLPEELFAAMRADRDEVPTRTRVVEATKPQPTAMHELIVTVPESLVRFKSAKNHAHL